MLRRQLRKLFGLVNSDFAMAAKEESLLFRRDDVWFLGPAEDQMQSQLKW